MAKVLVSLDDVLLRRVDQTAKARGLSRSAYLAGLAEHDTIRSAPGAAAARRALARLDQLFADSPTEDSTIAIRGERDADDRGRPRRLGGPEMVRAGERHVEPARHLRAAFEAGELIVLAPPLLQLEIVNVAGRRWRWSEPSLVDLAVGLKTWASMFASPS